VLSDQKLDLVQDGIDVAFRVGNLEDSSLIGRHLGDARSLLCASPDYIKQHGMPKHPENLAEHSLINLTQWASWQLCGANEELYNHNVKARIQVNDFASLYTLAMSGAGISPLPTLIAAPAIRAGSLVPVLQDWPFEASPSSVEQAIRAVELRIAKKSTGIHVSVRIIPVNPLIGVITELTPAVPTDIDNQ
jgi:DNA-binding transcriptional LysR family regulator